MGYPPYCCIVPILTHRVPVPVRVLMHVFLCANDVVFLCVPVGIVVPCLAYWHQVVEVAVMLENSYGPTIVGPLHNGIVISGTLHELA